MNRRIDGIFAHANAALLVLAIGLAVLDVTIFISLKIMMNVHRLPAVEQTDSNPVVDYSAIVP